MKCLSIPSWLLVALVTLQSSDVAALAVPRSQSLSIRALLPPYSLPQNSNSTNSTARAAGIAAKRLGWLYGPPVAGGPYFPTGALGEARVTLDQGELQADATPENTAAATDAAKGAASAPEYDGLQTLQDYTLLYHDQWQTTLPHGPAPGMLTNYTEDLLFSMERLSLSPYQVRRLNPSSDTLQFTISNQVAQKITGMTLTQLFKAGRLFYADYRDQKNLPRTSQYAAACDAYFYISPQTGDFLPLAIRTNVGSNLIYTPADTPDDWLLAKIMFNVNDVWFAQWNHLASTHEVCQITYLAAIRTLSDDHPVLAVFNRLMYEVYAIQPLAKAVLFTPGTIVDQQFGYTGPAAQDYTTNLYQNGGSGRFEANYFTTDLTTRGLIGSSFGPSLKQIPFYEDASVIHNAQQKFMTTFVNSYYSKDADVVLDKEMQAWVAECQGPAKAINFPAIKTRSALVNVLTHIAHLASTSHHTINTNELLTASVVLPFHPLGLYQPIPTSKNATDLAKYLPPLAKSLGTLSVNALFARPFFVGTNRTLIHQFDDPSMLSRMNTQTQQAAASFMGTMQAFSKQVAARKFDASGLSQGMPFVWQALDPNVAPYSLTT